MGATLRPAMTLAVNTNALVANGCAFDCDINEFSYGL